MIDDLRTKGDLRRFVEQLVPSNVGVLVRQLQGGTQPVVTTALLPAAGASMDGKVLIEDAGAGNRNLIVYAGGQRFRIDGGAAF